MGERGGRTLMSVAPRERESRGTCLCVFEACARTWRAERTVCVLCFVLRLGPQSALVPRARHCVFCASNL